MANLVTKILITARDEASAVFGSLQAKVAGVAAAIAGFFGVSLFRASVDSAREFELAMSAVAAAAGATAAEMAELEAAAKAAGVSTQYSSVEAANALEELVKAGLSATDAVAALPAALDLATAGGVGLAAAAGYISQTVAGMSLSFGDAARVADVLSQGANATMTSVEGLAQALSYAAPTANSLGLSLEETVAYLGKFADAGIDASRAGTALNSILAQFVDPASKFSEALRASGIRTRDFNQAMRELATAGPRASAAILAVGTEAGPALRALLNQGIGAFDDLVEKLEQSQGSAQAFAAVLSGNLDSAAKGLASAWEGVKIALGQPVLETLTRQVSAVAERMRAFVADGTAAQFGLTIKEAFESAGKWAADFFGRVDFGKVAADMRQYAVELQDTLTEIGNRATTAGNVLSTAWAVMGTGIATVRTAVYSLGAGMSWLASAFLADLAKITDGLAKITFGDLSAGFSAAAERMRAEARATYAVYEEFNRQAGAAFDGIVEGADDVNAAWAKLSAGAAAVVPVVEGVVDVAGEAGAAAARMGEQAAQAGKSLAEMGVSSQQIAQKLDEISRATGVTVTSTRALANAVADGSIAFNAATGAWGAGVVGLNGLTVASGDASAALEAFRAQVNSGVADNAQLGASAADTAEKIRVLKEQYQAFIAAGDTQGAAGVLVQIEALKKLGASAGDAADKAQALEAAFQALGVTSQAELARMADVAKKAFDEIRDSGKATPRELQESFKAYATAAIAANDGVADAVLKAQARQLGMRIEADETGKTVVRTMAESKKATEELAQAADDAAGSVGEIGDAAEDAASGMTSLVDAAKAQNAAVGSIQGTWMTASGAASKYAAEAREAVWSVRKSVDDLRGAFSAYVSAMEALDRRQAAISSSGAKGVEDLKLRLLELNGTEEQIAKARHERDEADIRRQMALLEIEAKRAARRGESDVVAQLKDEIKYMKEQLGLLDQIYKAEQRNKKDPDRTRGSGGNGGLSSGGSGGGSSAGGTSPSPPRETAPIQTGPVVHFNVQPGADLNNRVEVERLARALIPEIQKLQRRGL